MTDPGPSHTAEQPPPAAAAASAPDAAALRAAPDPTGHPAVDEVTASLSDLDGLPVDQHVGVFESAHDRLRAVLAAGGAGTTPSTSTPSTSTPTT